MTFVKIKEKYSGQRLGERNQGVVRVGHKAKMMVKRQTKLIKLDC